MIWVVVAEITVALAVARGAASSAAAAVHSRHRASSSINTRFIKGSFLSQITYFHMLYSTDFSASTMTMERTLRVSSRWITMENSPVITLLSTMLCRVTCTT